MHNEQNSKNNKPSSELDGCSTQMFSLSAPALRFKDFFDIVGFAFRVFAFLAFGSSSSSSTSDLRFDKIEPYIA
jgi:hypothetical protein